MGKDEGGKLKPFGFHCPLSNPPTERFTDAWVGLCTETLYREKHEGSRSTDKGHGIERMGGWKKTQWTLMRAWCCIGLSNLGWLKSYLNTCLPALSWVERKHQELALKGWGWESDSRTRFLWGFFSSHISYPRKSLGLQWNNSSSSELTEMGKKTKRKFRVQGPSESTGL